MFFFRTVVKEKGRHSRRPNISTLLQPPSVAELMKQNRFAPACIAKAGGDGTG